MKKKYGNWRKELSESHRLQRGCATLPSPDQTQLQKCHESTSLGQWHARVISILMFFHWHSVCSVAVQTTHYFILDHEMYVGKKQLVRSYPQKKSLNSLNNCGLSIFPVESGSYSSYQTRSHRCRCSHPQIWILTSWPSGPAWGSWASLSCHQLQCIPILLDMSMSFNSQPGETTLIFSLHMHNSCYTATVLWHSNTQQLSAILAVYYPCLNPKWEDMWLGGVNGITHDVQASFLFIQLIGNPTTDRKKLCRSLKTSTYGALS